MRLILVVVIIGLLISACGGGTSKTQQEDLTPQVTPDLTDSEIATPVASEPEFKGWRATYTEILSDDVETSQVGIGTDFIITENGSITTDPEELIDGQCSIKGAYTGTESYMAFLHTDQESLPFTALQTYRITFDYKILDTPDQGFEVLFYSPIGGSEDNWLPQTVIDGEAGDTGSATLTSTLGDYSDYKAQWNIVGTGAISVDNIQIVNVDTGDVFATEEAEQTSPGLSPEFRFSDYADAVVTTDPNEVIDGQASVRLSYWGHLLTIPDIFPLEGDTTYIVEFDYVILDRGTEDTIATIRFRPEGTTDEKLIVPCHRTMLKNENIAGTFSAGVLTSDASNYQLIIATEETASIVIDNIRIIRQDAAVITSQPDHWAHLSQAPYPRLGNYFQGTTRGVVQAGPEGEPYYMYSVDEVEDRLALSDVIAGFHGGTQSIDPDFSRRLRQKNPNIILLPYRLAQEQGFWPDEPSRDATIDISHEFQKAVADEWIAKQTGGEPVADPYWVYIKKMNISEFCPEVDGQTFNDFLVEWTVNTVMASGIWDGIFFDNIFGKINPHIQNFYDPALLEYDLNLNGIRDETPAWANEITRAAAIEVLEKIRAEVGDLEIIMGNTGPNPDIYLAQYVNGFIFEAAEDAWFSKDYPAQSEAGWRRSLDDYFFMQANTMDPQIIIFQGGGGAGVTPDGKYREPTVDDMLRHRFLLGTALLGSAFYEYDLFDARSAPYWFDEFTVDENGVAVKDADYKGYLGQALSDASEMVSPSVVIWEEDFEAGSLPAELEAAEKVYVSEAAADTISGKGSLVIDNPDHTQMAFINVGTLPDKVALTSGETFVVDFDWTILETIDGTLQANIMGEGEAPTGFLVPGIVAGDEGHAHFPLTLGTESDYSLYFQLSCGGGKVAIDNVRVTNGGVGPWRRDFENGFVLVNPLNRPYTFDAAELAGSLNRTGIKRILGSQAPDVNNGKPVTDTLTLEPYDAIILLADHEE